MKTFVKYKNIWCEYDKTTPISSATLTNNIGAKIFNINAQGLERVEANSFLDLDWANTPIYSKKYKTGWLSPDGEFYGCDYHFHDDQAYLVHKKDEKTLEENGWIKISYDIVKNGADSKKLEAFFNSNDDMIYPSNKQISYIVANYALTDKDNMLTHLMQIRTIKSQRIKENWGMER